MSLRIDSGRPGVVTEADPAVEVRQLLSSYR